MMRKGFALLEVVFALVISSMIAVILFQSLSQTNGILLRVVSVTALERRVALMQQQFETDFSGMFAPPLIEKDDDEAGEEGADKKTSTSAKATADRENKDKTAQKKEKQENAFKTFTFESDERGFVSILSFVTTNPLGVYQQPSARVVRVAYRVIADPENQGKLLLLRQESEELFLKKFEAATKKETIKPGQKPIRGYEIARDIENIKFEFFVEKIEKKEPEKAQPPGQQQPKDIKDEPSLVKKSEDKSEEKPKVFMLIDEWKKLSDDEKKKYETPEIPAFCSLKIFMNDERKRVHTFEFLFSTCAGYGPVIVKGVTSLPSAHEMQQRKAGQEETDRMFLHGGIPQPQGAGR
jgi:prepilin-type N-terminal cleavage/methylation domain-containing protein